MSAPPSCPTCGQPASEALGGPDHDWECRNEACPEYGQPVAADEPAAEIRRATTPEGSRTPGVRLPRTSERGYPVRAREVTALASLPMRKLAAWCHDRRRAVIGLWVAAFFIFAALWGTAAGEFVNNFKLPGTKSQRAYDLLKQKFPEQAGDTATVVWAVDEGQVLDNRQQIEAVRAEIEKSPEVLAVGDPTAEGASVSPDGRITFAQIQFAKGAGEADPKAVKEMAENTLALDTGNVQVELGGDLIHWSTAEQGGAGEIFGLLVAAVVLFLTLGVVAMGLPLLNALFAMVVSLGLMAIVGTRLLDVVDWTPQLAAMIGIGVGIDYALLILNRFRLERGSGRDVREATLKSLDTSGRAVLFAGIVVVIAMLGMMLLGISFLYGPAIGAALAVLFTMIAALTLMPAILGTRIGRRIRCRPTAVTATSPTARPASPRAGAPSSRAGRGRWPSARW